MKESLKKELERTGKTIDQYFVHPEDIGCEQCNTTCCTANDINIVKGLYLCDDCEIESAPAGE